MRAVAYRRTRGEGIHAQRTDNLLSRIVGEDDGEGELPTERAGCVGCLEDLGGDGVPRLLDVFMGDFGPAGR